MVVTTERHVSKRHVYRTKYLGNVGEVRGGWVKYVHYLGVSEMGE